MATINHFLNWRFQGTGKLVTISSLVTVPEGLAKVSETLIFKGYQPKTMIIPAKNKGIFISGDMRHELENEMRMIQHNAKS